MNSPRVSDINFTDVWIDQIRFLKRLGDGGFASVWLADQCDTNRKSLRPVAVKIFVDDPKNSRSFRETVESFQRDTRFLAGLASGNPIVEYHTNLVCDLFVDERLVPRTLRSRGEDAETKGWALTAFLIVMEFADGGHIGNTYRTEVVLQGDKTWVDHFLDICTALQAAHRKSIVHRDIKPNNIMWFRQQNRVKVGDFGTAKDFSEGDIGGTYLLGSIPYMSPESFRGLAPPERDIYALGCSFFEILTGERPFKDMESISRRGGAPISLDEYIERRTKAPVPDAFVLVPSIVSIDLSRILKKMMDPSVEARPKLEEIMEVLKNEKPIRSLSEEAASAVDLPKKPIYLSTYEIHPQFRSKVLNECPFFLFIRTNARSEYRLKTLFGMLHAWFGDTFSAYEVFGRCDFIIRLWASPIDSKLSDFCNKVVEQVLDGRKGALQVMTCESASYLGITKEILNDDHDRNETLVLLNEAQKHNAKEAESKLKKRGVYCRVAEHSAEGDRIRCFTLITNQNGVSESDRETKLYLIRRAIEESIPDLRRWNISLYLKAYQGVRWFNVESSDYVVSFLSPHYNEVVTIPSLILTKLREEQIQTDTLLATKRYFVESDKVLFPK